MLTSGLPVAELRVIDGDLLLTGSSILNIELGGTTQGSSYDWLDVTGSATLDGTLNASLFGSYSPAGGSTYDVITAASAISNDFASISLPAGFSTIPEASIYQLVYTAPDLPVDITPPDAQSTNEILVLEDNINSCL